MTAAATDTTVDPTADDLDTAQVKAPAPTEDISFGLADTDKGAAGTGSITNATDLLSRIVKERPDGEVRPQQKAMVEHVEQAIKNKTHLMVQAGTGTGKSLGYLIPAIHSGKRVIVSTATKQLGEQIVNDDMPILEKAIPKVGGRPFTYALMKGRNNYACQREVHSLLRIEDEAAQAGMQDALFQGADDPNSRRPSRDDLKKLNDLLKWVDDTETGDRSEAPAVPDRVWGQVSTDASGCTGRNCQFFAECFAEIAREEAKTADIVVTNHAQVAQDLQSPSPIFGDWDVLVTDEVHELESYLSSAWGLELSPTTLKAKVQQTARKLPKGDRSDYEQAHEVAEDLMNRFEALTSALESTTPGLLPTVPADLATVVTGINDHVQTLIRAFDLGAQERSASESDVNERKAASQQMRDVAETLTGSIADISDGTKVRWVEAGFGNRPPCVKVAPLWIGPKLMGHLKDRTLIATSATMTVNGKFDSFSRTLGLNESITLEDGTVKPPRNYTAVDVGTPFDYDKQAILYIPGGNFPAPVGAERTAHTAAVLDDLKALVKAAGGRTLALFTTRREAEAAAELLRSILDTPVLCQGDAPPSQLIAEFKDIESSTLCATMGFWHGVNAPGTTCTLVMTNKIPFPPMSDPLMSARSDAVNAVRPREGFNEIFVSHASVMLAQGVGRLIRTANDRGVVAILDPRILTKGYGKSMINSLPKMRIFRDRSVVENALARLDENAKNDKA